jgi:hypothetical protein
MPRDITEGWSGPLEFQFKVNGAIPGSPLPGTPVLILHNKYGVEIDTAADVAVTDINLWKVSYTPDVADLNAEGSPYSAHWKVTSGGQDIYFPSGAADVWTIYKQ